MRIPWYTAHKEKKALMWRQAEEERMRARCASIRAQCRAMVLSGEYKKEDFTDEIWEDEE